MTKEGSIIWKIGRKIEDYSYKNADKIIVISEDFKKNIMAKGVPAEKIVVVPNWVDTDAVVAIDRSENKLFDEYKLDRSKFYICYSGNIGKSQNMDMLIDCAKQIARKTVDIQFVLVGEGAAKDSVCERIAKEKITNIVMLPFQPYEDISHVFSLGDVGLIISKAGIGSNSVPSKTWSIMSAERAVLASFDKDSELNNIITKNSCGVCVDADDAEGFTNAILSLYDNRESISTYGKNGRNYVLQNLTKQIGTEKYLKVIEEVVDRID